MDTPGLRFAPGAWIAGAATPLLPHATALPDTLSDMDMPGLRFAPGAWVAGGAVGGAAQARACDVPYAQDTAHDARPRRGPVLADNHSRRRQQCVRVCACVRACVCSGMDVRVRACVCVRAWLRPCTLYAMHWACPAPQISGTLLLQPAEAVPQLRLRSRHGPISLSPIDQNTCS
eukprot:366136-Chlamydomonas_euryale.AAC.1